MADLKQIERLSRIRRLARDNPSPEEGAAAQGKLNELMLKHGVTERELDAFEGHHARPPQPPPPVPVPPPFQGSFVIHIMPGAEFGRVFGFGHGFHVHLNPNTTTSGSSSSTMNW
jgi:hypothetical protein